MNLQQSMKAMEIPPHVNNIILVPKRAGKVLEAMESNHQRKKDSH